MKKISVKIIISIILISLLFGLTLTIIGIENTSEIVKKTSNNLLISNSENKAKDISANIINFENMMDSFATSIFNNPFSKFQVKDSFGNNAYHHAYVESYLGRIDKYIKSYSQNIDGNKNIFILISPKVTNDGKVHGIVYDKDEDKIIKTKDLKLSTENLNDQNYKWFFKAKELKKGTWSNIHNSILDEEEKVITYVVPYYVEEDFAGVVGMEINYSYFVDEVQNIKIFENTKATLLDENFEIFYDKQYETGTYIGEILKREEYKKVSEENTGYYE
ncbi:cache domain-containing protein, partial [Oceanotoga teriensis]